MNGFVMNYLCLPYGLQALIFMIFTSWALSSLIEGLIWYVIVKNQVGKVRLLSVFGWMGLIQLVSTPLSYGVAIVIFGMTQFFTPNWLDAHILASTSIVSNPLGVFVGFFIIPLILETGLWFAGLRKVGEVDDQTREAGMLLSKEVLLFGVIITNVASFILGIGIGVIWVTQYSIWVTFVVGFLFTCVFVMFIVFVFFIVTQISAYVGKKATASSSNKALPNDGDSP
jgi:hypothetical protein